MIYEYHCPKCDQVSDVIKAVADFDRQEQCTNCGTVMRRAFAPKQIHLYNTSVQESYFHHGLGQVVKGDNHARRIAKEKKLIEVGNENPHKHVAPPRLRSYDD